MSISVFLQVWYLFLDFGVSLFLYIFLFLDSWYIFLYFFLYVSLFLYSLRSCFYICIFVYVCPFKALYLFRHFCIFVIVRPMLFYLWVRCYLMVVDFRPEVFWMTEALKNGPICPQVAPSGHKQWANEMCMKRSVHSSIWLNTMEYMLIRPSGHLVARRMKLY